MPTPLTMMWEASPEIMPNLRTYVRWTAEKMALMKVSMEEGSAKVSARDAAAINRGRAPTPVPEGTHDVFHHERLRPWGTSAGREPHDGAGGADGEPASGGQLYRVEAIIAERRRSNVNELRVKWVGWPMASCTWESEASLARVVALQKAWSGTANARCGRGRSGMQLRPSNNTARRRPRARRHPSPSRHPNTQRRPSQPRRHRAARRRHATYGQGCRRREATRRRQLRPLSAGLARARA